MLRIRPFATALLVAITLLVVHAESSLAAPGPTVECGQLTAYTAPDAGGPTAGTLRIGTLTPWEVLPAASISAAAATALPTIVNNAPTCVSVEFDADGKITSIDFAPHGDVTGSVGFDSGSGFYLFADRLIVPTFITDAYPGLAALFVTSYQAGTSLSVTFTVDVASGAFTGFDGHEAFCGAASVTGSGDGKIGNAIVPASVLDAADIAALTGATGANVCAAVHATGTVVADSGGTLAVDTDVVISVTAIATPPVEIPSPPQTSTQASRATPTGDSSPPLILLLVLALGALGASARGSNPQRRRP